MTDKDNGLDESDPIIREIENNLEMVLRKKREEVECELEEKIRREKEESERKILLIEREYEKEREALKEYHCAVSEYDAARRSLQTRMHDHLDRAGRCQEEIEKLTAATLEELKTVNALSVELVEFRQTSEKKIAQIRLKLKEKFGIATDSAPKQEANELVADLEQELSKLKKIKELLDKDPVPAATPPAAESAEAPPEFPEEAEIGPPEALEPEARRTEFTMPEINRLVEDMAGGEAASTPESVLPEPAPPAGQEAATPADEIDFHAAFESLEKFRKTERTDDAGEIGIFQSGERIILDGESLVRAIGQILEQGKVLAQKLDETESPKDQFFIKQELINSQEGLRKVVLREVKLCEKEGAFFPSYISEVLNKTVVKEMLERLNMDNWSNPENFRAFDGYAELLADAFYKRITPPARYIQSILEELQG